MYAVATVNRDAFLTDNVVVRTEKKMNFLAGASKLGPVETADSSAANHRDFHGCARCLDEEEKRID